ncbi:MAG: CBS domain-containing protein, partial [Bacteroidota bacterium]
MIAADLLSDGLVPLRTSDTGEEALNIMSEFYVRHLPVVNNTQLLALVSEDDILEYDVHEAVGSYDVSLRFPPVQENDH